MRCKGCDYSLWNVRGRTCPECGASFDPATHVFAPNMVQFCCINCDQQYYGTDSNGLIVPREFTCVKCGKHCSLSGDMLLRPAPGATEAAIEVEELPWTQRQSMGRLRSGWKTIWLCLGRPSSVGAVIGGPRPSGAGAWLMALCVPLVVSSMVTIMLFFGFEAASTSGTRYGGVQGRMLTEGAASVGLALAGIVVGLWVTVAISAGIAWLILLFDGRSPSYAKVFSCWAFASTPIMLAAIPCVGPYCMSPVIVVWTCVLAGIMMDKCKLARTGMVVLAAIAPPVVAGVSGVGLIMILMTSLASNMPAGGGATVGASGAAVASPDDPFATGDPDAAGDPDALPQSKP